MLKAPQFLAVGHVTADQDPLTGEIRAGGSAAFSSLTAARLGFRTALVTSVADEKLLSPLQHCIDIRIAPSSATTTFINDYARGQRRQWVRAVAAPIKPCHIPQLWLKAPVAHLCPIVREIGPEIASIFPDALLCLSPQGWLRQWDETGHVKPGDWKEAEELLSRVHIVVLSEEDIYHRPDLEQVYASKAPILALTLGDGGARIITRGDVLQVPAYPTRAMDSTGAGDVFAAALAIRYAETRDPLQAAAFATAAASISIEGPGLERVPTREEVTSRLQQWDWWRHIQGQIRENSKTSPLQGEGLT